MEPPVFFLIVFAIMVTAAIVGASIYGWMRTTKMKIENGYPLEGMWGQSLRPGTDAESKERIKLLTQENAQLRAELGAMSDRLVNVERIVTDSGYRIGHEIEKLRDDRSKVQ